MGLPHRVRSGLAGLVGAWLALAPAVADGGLLIGVPDAAPTAVLPDGALQTSWGAVRVCLAAGPGGPDAAVERQGRPDAVGLEALTESSAGPVRLAVHAFRAPVFPAGFDVLEAEVSNGGADRARVEVRLRLPEGVSADASLARQGGRPVVALPPPPAVLRCTGSLTPAQAMPGWGRPNTACHNAFRNIRAGMGGIPIAYQFLLDRPGEERTVMLGLCESHWAEAGKRPVVLQVEGAPERRVDPVAEWGQHRPGCLAFRGRDADGDRRIDIRVLPVADAPDRNTILNVIWVFPAEGAPDEAEVLAGRADSKALCVVDVGGAADGPVTVPGTVDLGGGFPAYRFELGPGERETLAFLVAVGGGAVPAWSGAAWTLAGLRQAAEDVWAGALAHAEARLAALGPEAAECRSALGEILVSRRQADDFYVVPASPEADLAAGFTFAAEARIVEALDAAGLTLDAERLLRVYWDRPAPAPFDALGQREDGHWEDASGTHGAHAQALLALARHATATGNRRWLEQAYPAIRAGADWLRGRQAAGSVPPEHAGWGARALASAAEAAALAGKADDAAWMNAAAEALGGPAAFPDEKPAYAGLGPIVDAANRVIAITAPR